MRRSSEYRSVGRKGARYRTSSFHVRILKNSLGRARLGIAVSKKVGGACIRNRIKRRLREYFRLNRDKIPRETDVVFIALEGAASLDTGRLVAELDQLFNKIN